MRVRGLEFELRAQGSGSAVEGSKLGMRFQGRRFKVEG